MNVILELDEKRYPGGSKTPDFQRWFRITQNVKNPLVKRITRFIFHRKSRKCFIELSENTKIGPGLYFGHPFGITINPDAVLGKNINIHKGVTIGQENRGARKGTPIIDDEVWIGINATIIGNIRVGNDVLIAPNSYVNCDIPEHSVVFGNPCIIKHKENATEGYLNRRI